MRVFYPLSLHSPPQYIGLGFSSATRMRSSKSSDVTQPREAFRSSSSLAVFRRCATKSRCALTTAFLRNPVSFCRTRCFSSFATSTARAADLISFRAFLSAFSVSILARSDTTWFAFRSARCLKSAAHSFRFAFSSLFHTRRCSAYVSTLGWNEVVFVSVSWDDVEFADDEHVPADPQNARHDTEGTRVTHVARHPDDDAAIMENSRTTRRSIFVGWFAKRDSQPRNARLTRPTNSHTHRRSPERGVRRGVRIRRGHLGEARCDLAGARAVAGPGQT